MTYADYIKIEDNNRYEILEGDLKMVSAPSIMHQGISRNLEYFIWSFVKEKRLGRVFDAPIDVVLNDVTR